jgi:hypothetical protein
VTAANRRKGACGEREAAVLLGILYPGAERKPMQARGAARDGCEVEGTPWWVEVKSAAAPRILPALRQARADAKANGDSRPPLVVAKTTRQGWTVTLDWMDFARLVREGQQARSVAISMAQETQ